MIDDSDFLDDPDDEDAPQTKVHAGILAVPGTARNEREFMASTIGFRADFPVLIVDFDEETNTIWIAPSSLSALRDFGFLGSSIAEAELFLAPHSAGSPRHQPKGTRHEPPR